MTDHKMKFVGLGMLLAMVGIPIVAATAAPEPEPAPVVERPEVTEPIEVEVVTDIPVPPDYPGDSTPDPTGPEQQQDIPLPPDDYPGDSTWDEANPEDTQRPDWLPADPAPAPQPEPDLPEC